MTVAKLTPTTHGVLAITPTSSPKTAVAPKSESPVQITADDIRPDLHQIDAMERAMMDMHACKVIFDGWGAQLDQSKSKRMSELELQLRSSVSNLRNDAENALRASDEIHRCHQEFATLTSRRLDRAARAPFGQLTESKGARVIGENICAHSATVSRQVEAMKDNLKELMSLIDDSQKTSEKRSLWKTMYQWLVKAFRGFAGLFSCGSLNLYASPLHGPMPSPPTTGTTLCSAAGAICEDLERGRSDEYSFRQILRLLQHTIPREAENASTTLTAFQGHHRLLQFDIQGMQGTQVRISKEEAETARDDWQLQSARMQLVRVSRR